MHQHMHNRLLIQCVTSGDTLIQFSLGLFYQKKKKLFFFPEENQQKRKFEYVCVCIYIQNEKKVATQQNKQLCPQSFCSEGGLPTS